MSLPMARARRKNVPSIQRSPYFRTLSHSRTLSAKPRVVMSQASWSCSSSQASLTRRISLSTRANSSSRPSSAVTIRSTFGVHAAQHPGLARSAQLAGKVVDVAALEAQRGLHLVQRRAAPCPQLAVLTVAEELVGLA